MSLPIFHKAQRHPERTAIISDNRVYTYGELLQAADNFAQLLLQGESDLAEARVAYMVKPGFDYVSTQWGIWKAGGIAVPLCITYPLPSLQYVLEDTQASIVVVSPEFSAILGDYCREKGLRFIVLRGDLPEMESSLPELALERRAMILYTSGTTNLPKGVVSTHKNIAAQVESLLQSWEYSAADHTLCILPLHHVHGIINVVSCTLWAGGTVQFMPQFEAKKVLDLFLQGALNVFMAVPTIYFKLIEAVETMSAEDRNHLRTRLQQFRLMISGSAALPVSVMEKWEKISGHRLLERYGMTEIGMAISNPYAGERRAGYIGIPLPGVSVRLVDEQQNELTAGEVGEIQIKGDTVFQEYWQRPEATAQSFTPDGWFMTGDTAVVEEGYYRILGRTSMDIIKSGGYKLSALEIEEVLRTHPAIADCAVVGLPSEEWGETVAAALVTKSDLDLATLNSWMRERMPAYRVPRQYLLVEELPRNAMGKVTKKDVKMLFNA
ncbi:acyl-CoA synthetase [Haliscomenobacter hydrossis]|uniref:Long-chain-fatty-acid--CoA ligase n=1 Tax=Haliscomenobacter hydrossis (strain ATCC 27775 / DSM 1100 / LMG 10767 / O) TaxID=760192 RepID=F4KQ22_HALH1|nr:acyl-CoA synthetase [Haliscomenobacter hydrossis]AEE53226.1 Long-chain-fatty-acid--CoA ligase [Haliscomenobacter hydrossis DSM 1100]